MFALVCCLLFNSVYPKLIHDFDFSTMVQLTRSAQKDAHFWHTNQPLCVARCYNPRTVAAVLVDVELAARLSLSKSFEKELPNFPVQQFQSFLCNQQCLSSLFSSVLFNHDNSNLTSRSQWQWRWRLPMRWQVKRRQVIQNNRFVKLLTRNCDIVPTTGFLARHVQCQTRSYVKRRRYESRGFSLSIIFAARFATFWVTSSFALDAPVPAFLVRLRLRTKVRIDVVQHRG